MEKSLDIAPLTKVVGLVGLPRSGTTMLNSIFGVHSRIEAIYEPWNRDVEDNRVSDHANLQEILACFVPERDSARDIVVIKETATHVRFLNYIANLLLSCQSTIQTELVLLWRNPFHVFLSEIEARRTWWEDASVKVSIPEFDQWAAPRLGALWRMLEMGCASAALVVSYEALVADKGRVIPAMMLQLGVQCEPAQLNFEKYLDKTRVRGDLTVAINPSPISACGIQRREGELNKILATIETAASYPYVKSVADILAKAENLQPMRLSDPMFGDVVNTLRSLFETWHRELGS